MSVFTGACTALSTPFTKDGINFEAFEALIEYQIDGGIDALLVCGTTGEPATMTEGEMFSAIEFVVKTVNGRVPVVAGTGTNCTAKTVAYSKKAAALGVDALLVVNPYYNKGTFNGIVQHYKMISDAAKKPIIVYDVPGRTGKKLSPALLKALAKVEHVTAIKAASADLSQISDFASQLKGKIDIYSGNDDNILPIMSLGGLGVITTIGNIAPNAVHTLTHDFLNGNVKAATEMQVKMIPVIRALFKEVNPTPVKYALSLLGFNMGLPRLPMAEAEQSTKDLVAKTMQAFGFDIMQEIQ